MLFLTQTCWVLILSFLSSRLALAFSLQGFGSTRKSNVHIPHLKMTSSTPQIDEAKDLIAKAISVGAPAYNAGDISKCALVYKETAINIASMLPQNLQNSLEETIFDEYKDSNEAAWAFRRQFDTIIEYQIPFMPGSPSDDISFEKFTVNMVTPEPFVVNDNVMGGMSQGQWMKPNTFRGHTSLANNGGFASLRWRMNTIQNWSYAKGIYMRVKHSNPDEHTFRIILKDTTCEQVRGANFKNIFSNPHQKDAPIMIPFESFDQIEQMGRPLPGPVFNRAAVTELGLMAIKPTVVGAFELEIKEWGLYL